MQRVLVLGCGGAGKSTFARALAARTDLPLIHLDSLYWRPGWVETPPTEWKASIASIIAGDHWILDGNYGGTMDMRVTACDTVIFLDLPRALCLRRVITRYLRFRGRSRPDMTPGCPERLSYEFLRWIWTYRRKRRPGILARLSALRADQRPVILHSPAEVTAFLG
jgi:adenylate kinase family enzyme